MADKKLMVIAIDGATWDVLIPMMSRGAMPNLKRIRDENFSGILNSTIPPVTAPAWASFITGTRPEHNGIFDFSRHVPGSYKSSMNNANSIRRKSLWQILAEQGKTVGTINLPMTYPPTKVKGFMIPGFLAPGVSSQKILTYPENLIDEIEREVGPYQIYLESSPKSIIHADGKAEFLKKCCEIVQKRGRTARFLYEKYQPDFFMVHFLMTDVVQHWFWHVFDDSHPAFNKSEAKELLPEVEKFYATVDENVGALINLADANRRVIILSDHGFGPLRANFYLNRWFQQMGYLKLKSGKAQALGTIRKIIATIDFLNLRNRLLPSGKGRVALEKSLQHDFLIDWQKTRCSAVPAAIYGNVFLNIHGRDQAGILKPDEETEAFKKELMEQLGKIEEKGSRERVISKSFLREEIFPGDTDGYAPDLLLQPEDGYAIFSQLNEKDLIRKVVPWQDITGTHRIEGIFLAKGENINAGKGFRGGAEIIDLAPTILYLLGLEIPGSMDGKVLEEILENEFLENNPPRFSSKPDELTSGKTETYSEEEEELIRKRLQGLGYLE